ncbi:trypsin-like peptidase domain-containing protein [Cyanobium sp. WKJ7-Wakatipu]|nr:trypsin-like peptidase domain-containing protein [Cyanobium sp. WKJ7-Wakatipu]
MKRLLLLIFQSSIVILAVRGQVFGLPAVKNQPQPSSLNHKVTENKLKSGSSTDEGSDKISRASITVQVINGDQKGSGVIIRDKQKKLWIVTNRHVVGESLNVCVLFSDGNILPGIVFRPRRAENDIAFISYAQVNANTSYADPDLLFDTESVSLVLATGYAASTNTYLETSGVTIPMLRGNVLESGYSLTYSNQVEKGMSGGGIFSDDGQIIGINALHSEPLWIGDWYDSRGMKVKASLGKKLDTVSVGIAIQTIFSQLDRLEVKNNIKGVADDCPNKNMIK